MIDKNHEIYKHKHICLVGDHYNPLAIIRSLGEEGIRLFRFIYNGIFYEILQKIFSDLYETQFRSISFCHWGIPY